MDATCPLDWANPLLRWARVTVAIAWVGPSFHFVFLDHNPTRPDSPELLAKGVPGELSAARSGSAPSGWPC